MLMAALRHELRMPSLGDNRVPISSTMSPYRKPLSTTSSSMASNPMRLLLSSSPPTISTPMSPTSPKPSPPRSLFIPADRAAGHDHHNFSTGLIALECPTSLRQSPPSTPKSSPKTSSPP